MSDKTARMVLGAAGSAMAAASLGIAVITGEPTFYAFIAFGALIVGAALFNTRIGG